MKMDASRYIYGKPGRRPIAPEKRRDHVLVVRVTGNIEARVKAHAKRIGTNASRWLYTLITSALEAGESLAAVTSKRKLRSRAAKSRR